MIDNFTLPYLLTLTACFLGGIVLGYAYFRALRMTADLIVSGGHPLLGFGLTLGRVALIGTGFYVAVLAGGFALIATLAGVLCTKTLMLRKIRRASA